MINVKEKLLAESQKDYKKFSASLIPNVNNVLGVRLPILRKIAKDIYRTQNWQDYLKLNNDEFMEETMLKGFIIGLIKAEPEEILGFVKDFIPQIDNWAVCDCFCTGLKFTNKNQDLVWDFLQPYLKSDKEYEIRFATVMLLGYFVNEKYILKVLDKIDTIKSEDYYAKMAAAWAVSVCFAKFPQETFEYLQKSNLNDWTFNKSIQKCIESYRVTDKMKDEIRKLKRKQLKR